MSVVCLHSSLLVDVFNSLQQRTVMDCHTYFAGKQLRQLTDLWYSFLKLMQPFPSMFEKRPSVDKHKITSDWKWALTEGQWCAWMAMVVRSTSWAGGAGCLASSWCVGAAGRSPNSARTHSCALSHIAGRSYPPSNDSTTCKQCSSLVKGVSLYSLTNSHDILLFMNHEHGWIVCSKPI